jgi:hypothetical protein
MHRQVFAAPDRAERDALGEIANIAKARAANSIRQSPYCSLAYTMAAYWLSLARQEEAMAFFLEQRKRTTAAPFMGKGLRQCDLILF